MAVENTARAILRGSESWTLWSFRNWAPISHAHEYLMCAGFTEQKRALFCRKTRIPETRTDIYWSYVLQTQGQRPFTSLLTLRFSR